MTLVLILVLIWLGQGAETAPEAEREGTLAGAGGVRAGDGDPRASVGHPTDPDSSVPSPQKVLEIDFDERLMGSGIGAEWGQTVGEADGTAIAAYPTAVDRSARLEIIGDDRLVETCRPVETQMSALKQLHVDVLLSSPTVTAVVSLGAVPPGETSLRISLSTSGTAVTDGRTGLLAEGEGLDIGRWYRAEIAIESDGVVWRLMALEGAMVSVVETGVETDVLATGFAVCLAVSGEPEDAVYFDDLTITATQEP